MNTDIKRGSRVRVIASPSALVGISIPKDMLNAIMGASGKVVLIAKENKFSEDELGIVGVKFGKKRDDWTWYFPYSRWQEFLEVVG